MSPGTRKARGKWSGATIFGLARLTCAGDFILILDDLVEGIPEVRDCFVFSGHGENLFDLAIQDVCQGEEFFETLFVWYERNEWLGAPAPPPP